MVSNYSLLVIRTPKRAWSRPVFPERFFLGKQMLNTHDRLLKADTWRERLTFFCESERRPNSVSDVPKVKTEQLGNVVFDLLLNKKTNIGGTAARA